MPDSARTRTCMEVLLDFLIGARGIRERVVRGRGGGPGSEPAAEELLRQRLPLRHPLLLFLQAKSWLDLAKVGIGEIGSTTLIRLGC
ncbi:unnamed protein product [Linum trigynum]|uniref:Uncharacterized protein n=1 Tax=Linum trigynum TaxID=586398 RepID=A0AAV2FYD6_9ROSI